MNRPSNGLGSIDLTAFAEPASRIIELGGIAVILTAVIFAGVRFAMDLRRDPNADAYGRCRANLGRGILLGLELLVGADIIATVTAPLTWESVGLLAGIVLIRTFLSFSLETEIEGRPPWLKRADDDRPKG